MRSNRWISACGAALLVLASGIAVAKEHGRGNDEQLGEHGRGHNKQKGGPAHEYRYADYDRGVHHGWYSERRGNLPPGLAKRDELPPGLARQLAARGTLPPGLRKKIQPCPIELVRRLPPPPLGYQHVFIGGRIVLLNRQNYMVLDVFRFGN
jgi:hypothetical protein